MRRNLPRGAKIFLILNEINRVNGMRYSDVVKFAFELTYGKNTFDPIKNVPMTNYTSKNKNDGKYYVNSKGMAYLEKNWSKFSKFIISETKPKVETKVTNNGTSPMAKGQQEYSTTITLSTSNAFENPKPHGFGLDEVVGYQHIQKDGKYGVGKIIKIVTYSKDCETPNEFEIKNNLGMCFTLTYVNNKFYNRMGFECKLIKF